MTDDTEPTGAQLPGLDIPIDRTTIVACAIASQDFEDVHHDPGKAQERGTPDIFMSINGTNGFIDRYVTDWAGPGAQILSVALRLGVPCFPGDTLQLRGAVVERDGRETTVRVLGTTARGTHVTADLVLIEEGVA